MKEVKHMCNIENDNLKENRPFTITYVPISVRYDIYIHDEIKSMDEYTDLFSVLDKAEEYDMIYIHLASAGGDLQTSLAIRDFISLCKAQVTIIVEGMCASGASIILLSNNVDLQLMRHSYVMIHSYRSIEGGKFGEQMSSIDFSKKWFEDIMHDVYGGFLTEEEIKNVLNDKDYYFNANEVSERFNRMLEYRNKKAEEEMKKHEKKCKKNKKST